MREDYLEIMNIEMQELDRQCHLYSVIGNTTAEVIIKEHIGFTNLFTRYNTI